MGIRREFVTSCKIVRQIVPKDVDSDATNGGFVSLRNYQGAGFLINVGAHSGDAVGITFEQSKNIDGGTTKDFTDVTRGYKSTRSASGGDADKWEEFTITSGTFDVAANTTYFIPIRPEWLDVTNDYDCIRIEVEAGSAATLVNADLLLWGGPEGILDDRDHIPSAVLDREPNEV